jgi:hypothetical protein
MHHELEKPQMYENPYAVYGEKYVHRVRYRQKNRLFPTRGSNGPVNPADVKVGSSNSNEA